MKLYIYVLLCIFLDQSSALPAATNGSELEGRAGIVGGTEVRDMRDVPYAARITIEKILMNPDLEGVPYGGGTLIAPAVLVTAAHLTHEARSVTATAGHPIYDEDSPNKQVQTSTTWIHHPDWDYDTMNADISVVYFHTPFQRTPQVQFAMIPKPTFKLARSQILRASGWGRLTGNHGPKTNTLHTVLVPFIPTEECRVNYDKMFEEGMAEYTVQEDTLCAGYFGTGGKDACQGDSGGPLILEAKKSKQPVLVGVISWGFNCARAGYPGVYADVSKYNKFIKAAVNVFKLDKGFGVGI